MGEYSNSPLHHLVHLLFKLRRALLGVVRHHVAVLIHGGELFNLGVDYPAIIFLIANFATAILLGGLL